MDSADDSVTRHDVDTAMDSADDSLTGQTAHTSLLDDDHFDLFAAVGTTTDSTDLGGADDTAAVHTNNGGITNPLDDLFDFCSLPSLPLQLVPVNERSSGHPDLLIDIGESDPSNLSPETAPSDNRSLGKYPTDNQFLETVPTDNLLGGEITEQVPADKPSKIQSWDKLEQEIDSSWTVVDKGMTDDPFCDDMLFGDGADKRKSSSGQQVPDILADDLLSGTPDLINSHEANMDGVDNDDIFGFLEDADVNNSAWPFKKRDSSYSSQKSAVSTTVPNYLENITNSY
ncbi:uncharacterized protein LOC121366339 [Gigantopelta aegis]|uniref:uncharacterized protein LOC121366339 n=1 Tax=Gigantopelta aegis TaxID=1735272 RepID=UPI001B8890FF|nr:uncharacterized protein LOC121366339 [Gigantopelta aegis]